VEVTSCSLTSWRSALWLGVALVPAATAAQTIQGRVLEEGRGLPVAGAQLSLLDTRGRHRVGALSDETGRFVLAPPEAGEYVIEAARIGYEPTRSPLLALKAEGEAPLEIMMRPRPVGLEGFEVSVKREAEEFLRPFGQSPTALGRRWLDRKTIEESPTRVGPGQLIRWRSIPGVWVHGSDGAPGRTRLCVTFQRARSFGGSYRCALVLLDGAIISLVEAQELNPDQIEAIAILTPVDATTFFGTEGGGGAVMMWSRRGGGH
jgi:hypothetical protein